MTEVKENSRVLNLDALRKSHKPIAYYSKHGEIHLRRFLRMMDLEILLQLLKDDSLDSKNFTINVLNQVALIQEIDFSPWSEKEILRLTRKWAKIALAKGNENQKIGGFDDFRSAVSNHINQFFAGFSESIEDLMKSVQSSFAATLGVVASMQSASKLISDVLQSALKTSSFVLSAIPKLPDFSDFFKSMLGGVEEAEEIREILSKSEYELGILLLDSSDLRGLKGKKFKPVVTRKLMNATMSGEFSKEIERLFSIAPLQKRWPAIKQAMVAHQTHQYYLSTPVFLAQTEGVFTELLILRNLAERVKGSVVGKRDGNKLNGLQKKVNLAKGKFEPGLEKTAVDVVLGRMVEKRNTILHGGNSKQYGTPRMSTETFLLLYALASFLESDLDNQTSNIKSVKKQ